jgi:NAD+-dependent protein deacetylase SIR2
MAKYGLSDPQEIFDIELFRIDPSIFYAFANKLMPKVQGVSLTHKFLKALQEQGKLLTVYTQNVDDLELHAGVTNDKVIQVHGSVSQFICMKCGIQSSSSVYKTEAVKGEIPYCRPCSQAIQAPRRKARKQKKPAKRRRSGRDAYGSEEGDSEEGDDNIAQGVMKV